MASDFHLIWREQCDAARDIKERFGTFKAMGYLVGEKLVNYAQAYERNPLFAAELSMFVSKVREIFDQGELQTYFLSVKRIGALGHTCSEEEMEFLREHNVIMESPVQGAEDVLVVDLIRGLLLEKQSG